VDSNGSWNRTAATMRQTAEADMRKFLATVCITVVFGLAGCASTVGGTAGTSVKAGGSFTDDIDYAKMAIITEEAQRRGYRIVWVHPPQKNTKGEFSKNR
jgi:starvation-inducible outer membrane lipoprotein